MSVQVNVRLYDATLSVGYAANAASTHSVLTGLTIGTNLKLAPLNKGPPKLDPGIFVDLSETGNQPVVFVPNPPPIPRNTPPETPPPDVMLVPPDTRLCDLPPHVHTLTAYVPVNFNAASLMSRPLLGPFGEDGSSNIAAGNTSSQSVAASDDGLTSLLNDLLAKSKEMEESMKKMKSDAEMQLKLEAEKRLELEKSMKAETVELEKSMKAETAELKKSMKAEAEKQLKREGEKRSALEKRLKESMQKIKAEAEAKLKVEAEKRSALEKSMKKENEELAEKLNTDIENLETELKTVKKEKNSEVTSLLKVCEELRTSVTELEKVVNPLHKRILLDDARKKVMKVAGFNPRTDSWKTLQDQYTTSFSLFKNLPSAEIQPLTDADIELLYSDSNKVRQPGNAAAHVASQDQLGKAVAAEKNEKDRIQLQRLYDFAYPSD